VKEFTRGREWWLLRDDGSWVRWNRETMAWDPQPEPPPQTELVEVVAQASHGDSSEVEPVFSGDDWRTRSRWVREELGRGFNVAATVMFVILVAVLVALAWIALDLFDAFWGMG
jgi:hypothetical protein